MRVRERTPRLDLLIGITDERETSTLILIAITQLDCTFGVRLPSLSSANPDVRGRGQLPRSKRRLERPFST